MDYKLPYPTKEELTMTTKSQYFARVLPMNLDRKINITQEEYTAWIHHNFESVYLFNKELTFKQYKKY
jgi:hypothetical protein